MLKHLTLPHVHAFILLADAAAITYKERHQAQFGGKTILHASDLAKSWPSPVEERMSYALTLFINVLDTDAKAELLALTWAGREGGTPADYMDHAKSEADETTGEYLSAKVEVGDYLRKGLESIGLQGPNV